MAVAWRLRGGSMAAALAALAALPAMAADPVKLRVADSFPSGHYLTKVIIQPWMAEITRRTDGAVTFEYFPSQQLGKATDMLTLTQTGVTNIGYVAPAYTSEKMPLSEAAMLPGAFQTSCQGTMAYAKAAREGAIAAQDYASNKIRLLTAVALPPYQILTVKGPVKTEADLKGLKLRSTGGAQDLTLRTVGVGPGPDGRSGDIRIALARHARRRAVPARQRRVVQRREARPLLHGRSEFLELHRRLFDQRRRLERICRPT